jgi:hypothetical protein
MVWTVQDNSNSWQACLQVTWCISCESSQEAHWS